MNTKQQGKKKPLAKVIDDQVKKGGNWRKICATVNRIASRRGMWGPYRPGDIRHHIKYRLEKDPNYFGGKIKMSDEGVEIEKNK